MTSRWVTVAGYAAVMTAGAILEVVSRRHRSRIPGMAATLRRVMATRSGRVGLIAGWAWLGLHFFAR